MYKKDANENIDWDEFSESTSKNHVVICYIVAFLTAAVPVWVYHSVRELSVQSFGIFYVVVTLVGTYLLATAYQNVTSTLKSRIQKEREDKVTASTVQAAGKKKKDAVATAKGKAKSAAARESVAFSIFFNNAFFFFLCIVFGFFILKSVQTPINYVASIVLASGIVRLASNPANINQTTKAKKK
mmetsp:Transcript_2908/g.7095  ORF Transcript_2908/g.7095 Transcript_2908/m.7095 type:complete len:185 (-) Transcript_2908:145-699(-)